MRSDRRAQKAFEAEHTALNERLADKYGWNHRHAIWRQFGHQYDLEYDLRLVPPGGDDSTGQEE